MEQLKRKMNGKFIKQIVLIIVVIIITIMGVKVIAFKNELIEIPCLMEYKSEILCKEQIIENLRGVKLKKDLIKLKSRRYKYVNCKLGYHYEITKYIYKIY